LWGRTMIAVVARAGTSGLQYLTGAGSSVEWSAVARKAARYPDVRAATRAAMSLSSAYRAFALPKAALDPDGASAFG
jgi:hypothetical protein